MQKNEPSTLSPQQQKQIDNWLVQDLLVARNRNWLPAIQRETARQPTLFAVGAAHLLGSHGLIELLRQQGYRVTPEPKLKVWL